MGLFLFSVQIINKHIGLMLCVISLPRNYASVFSVYKYFLSEHTATTKGAAVFSQPQTVAVKSTVVFTGVRLCRLINKRL